MNTIDHILESKVGHGYYQYKSLLLMGLIDMNDGMQLAIASLIMPVLKNHWALNISQIEHCSSSFYLGMFIGSIVTGILSDIYFGRYPMISCSLILIILSSFSFLFNNSYQIFIILRFIYGMSFGLSTPLTTSYIAEITILKKRGKFLVFINFMVSVGKLVAIMMAFCFLDHQLESGNYQMMIVVSCVPMFYVFYQTRLFLLESPRYLVYKNNVKQAIQNLIRMAQHNGNKISISDDQQHNLQSSYQNSQSSNHRFKMLELLNKQNRRLSVLLWLIWISINLTYHGQLTILPFLSSGEGQQQSSKINNMFYAILGEMFGIIVSFNIIDHQKLGRKYSLVLFFMLSFCSNYLTVVMNNRVSFFISRFTMKVIFSVLYTYTTEIYNTQYRIIGYGTASAIGRFGTVFMPYIVFPLLNIDHFYPLYLFSLVSLLGAVFSFCLEDETNNKYLDHSDKCLDDRQLIQIELVSK